MAASPEGLLEEQRGMSTGKQKHLVVLITLKTGEVQIFGSCERGLLFPSQARFQTPRCELQRRVCSAPHRFSDL